MKIALLHEDYHGQYTAMSREQLVRHPEWDYCTHIDALMRRSFYIGDSYSRNLNDMGHTARDFIPGVAELQSLWQQERRKTIPLTSLATQAVGAGVGARLMRKTFRSAYNQWLEELLVAQIQEFAPNVVYFFSGTPVSEQLICRLKTKSRVFLQWTCPLRTKVPYAAFDAIVSGSREMAEHFRRSGCHSRYVGHGFDTIVLERMKQKTAQPQALFCGSLSSRHASRQNLFRRLAENPRVTICSPDARSIPHSFRNRLRPPVFGVEMYEAISDHLLVLHQNIDALRLSVSAKRLYEAAGVGRVVLTNRQDGMERYFEPDAEIVLFDSDEECEQKLNWLLENPDRTIEMGRRAQARVLREHTLAQRMQALANVFEDYAR